MDKIDLVYILGGGSRWRNNEMRYSLRSAEKNLNIGKVYIIGECPDWITGVTHIQCPDSDKNKLANAREKYLKAAKDSRISKDFILMNDDFFILKKIKDIPYYSRGFLEKVAKKHPTKGGYYYNALIDTNKVLQSVGIVKPIDYEVHAPIIFNKEKLETVIKLLGNKKAYLFRSCYGNIYQKKAKKATDFKAAKLSEFIWQKNRNREFISINDNMVAQKEFRDWIRRKFPNPSKYETDRGAGSDILPGNSVRAMRYYAKQAFQYFGQKYGKGDIIDGEIIDEMRNNPKLRDLFFAK